MTKVEIYEHFLEKKYLDGAKEKINVNFSLNDSNEEFDREINRFINLINCFFYHENMLLTSINSYAYVFEKEIEYFSKLYNYSKNINCNHIKQFIAEYIFTYQITLESNKYKNDISDIEKYKSDFYKIFDKSLFYRNGEIYESTIDFYKNIIDYYKNKEDRKIHSFTIERMLYKFESRPIGDAERYILNNLISLNIGLDIIIKYDNDPEICLEMYNNYILNNVNFSYAGESAYELLVYLSQKKLLKDDILKQYFNKLIDLINMLIEDILNQKNTMIQNLSEVDNLLRLLNNINKQVVNINLNGFKDKIKECIILILYCKRKMLSDNEYVEASLNSFDYKTEVTKDPEILEKVKNNPTYFYIYLKINFDSMLFNSIQSYSSSPISHIFNKYNIDTNEGNYSKEKEDDNENLIEDYYINMGIKYEKESKDKLVNFLNKDYYKTMINYINSSYLFGVEIMKWQIGDYYSALIEIIKTNFFGNEKQINNDYIFISKEIICIEYLLNQVFDNKGIEFINMKEALISLFEKYKEDDFYRNGIMYVYYILYSKEGLNLRNKIFHGSYTNKSDLKTEIYMVSSCLFFVNYMYGRVINHGL